MAPVACEPTLAMPSLTIPPAPRPASAAREPALLTPSETVLAPLDNIDPARSAT